MRPRSRRGAGAAAGCLALVLTLGACGSDIDLPDITLPDVTLPDITPPDITLPTITPPDITLPTLPTLPGGGDEEPTDEQPTDEPTQPGTGTESPTVTVTSTPPPAGTTTDTPTTTEPDTTDVTAAPEPPEDEAEDEGIPWWVWLLGALVLLALVVWLVVRRAAAARARREWAERVDLAVERLGHPLDVLRRPATLVPAEQELVRRAVAEVRDLSVTFSELATAAPDEELGLGARDTADALRALATSAEIENEGLAAGRIVTFEERQDAEARRLAALSDVDATLARPTGHLAG